MRKEIVYIDMDGVLCDYVRAKKDALVKEPQIIYPQSQFGFFINLESMNLATSAFNWFLNSDKYDPYILTAPSLKNPMSYMEKRVWVETYLGEEGVERLIISPRKDLSKGEYLIDDNLSGRGQDKFEGEFIHFGSEKYPNWRIIMEYFKNKQ